MKRQATTIVLESLRPQISHMSMGCCCERFFAHPLALLDTAASRVTALGFITVVARSVRLQGVHNTPS